ncbi:iron ABC transporter permease [Hyphomicrobiales bacterium 4NK60-0047b]
MTTNNTKPAMDTKTSSFALDTNIKPAKRPSSWGWVLLVLPIIVLVLLPLLSIVIMSFNPSENIWPHLISTILPRSIRDTFILMSGVGLLSLVIGTGTAWLVTMYQFRGRRFFEWALLLPLAMPTYMMAYCAVDLLEYSGPVQTGLRSLFGFQDSRDYWFPNIASMPGAIIVLSLVLYPYVYLAARASFMQQSVCALEVARTLGRTPMGAFWNVGLPLARPALIAGLVLALMECLNDYGAVAYFGIETLTASVYSTWQERSNLGGAAQIATLMLLIIIVLLYVERRARSEQKYFQTTGYNRDLPVVHLHGLQEVFALIACALPFILGFALPFYILLSASFRFIDFVWTTEFWRAAGNSVLLASLTAVIAVSVALIITYGKRVTAHPILKPIGALAGTGYAIPGAILAIGILIPLAAFDNMFDSFMRGTFGISTGLLLSGSLFALLFAYLVRFLAISLGTIEAGFHKISPNLDGAARTLGQNSLGGFRLVLLPIMRPSVAAAALLVFVDTMKELPATLLLRPFNFDSLATLVFEFASREEFEEAGLAGLTIVAFGLIPLLLLNKTVSTGRSEQSKD